MRDDDDFWEACAPFLAEGRLVEGTIMSSTCARTPDGEFVGMGHHKGPGIVVKLHRDRVSALIEQGVGKPFAPAKKVFKEWVLVEEHDEDRWHALLEESIDFVS
ncbi:MAG: hypothetical protein AAF567_10110 [Actinomycetota bacterium]